MNIQSTKRVNLSSRRQPQKHELPTGGEELDRMIAGLERKIYIGDAIVGAFQGAIEGSTAVFTATGDFARAPMSVAAGAGIALKAARSSPQKKVALSMARSAVYGAIGAAFGSTGILVAIGLGATVGAASAFFETRAELSKG